MVFVPARWVASWVEGARDDIVEITQQIARDGIAGLGFEVEEVEPRQVGRCRQSTAGGWYEIVDVDSLAGQENG